jgi:hypothetical protein
MKKFASL